MAEPRWQYHPARDRAVWTRVVAGAAGAVPAGALWPPGWGVAARLADLEGWAVGGLFLVPSILLAAWAAVCWVAAARRAARLRRLARVGVEVRATADAVRIVRGKGYAVAAVVYDLRYEVDGREYRQRTRTYLPDAAGLARAGGVVSLAIDPDAPLSAAVAVGGRLG